MFNLLFGGGRNAVAQTVEVFRENTENGAARDAVRAASALEQFAAEFSLPKKHWFDVVIDGLNRVPRPAMALGTLALFLSAMIDPVWFAERMTGIALVPEPLWWLLGAIVSFYFGARHQSKSQDFQRSIAETLARAPQVSASIGTLRALDAAGAAPLEATDPVAIETADRSQAAENLALVEWRRHSGAGNA